MPVKRLPLILPERFRPKSKAGKVGMIAGGVVAGLIAIDAIALVVTVALASSALAR